MKIKELLNEGWQVMKPAVAKNGVYEVDLVMNKINDNTAAVIAVIYVSGSHKRKDETTLFRGDISKISLPDLIDRATRFLNTKFPT